MVPCVSSAQLFTDLLTEEWLCEASGISSNRSNPCISFVVCHPSDASSSICKTQDVRDFSVVMQSYDGSCGILEMRLTVILPGASHTLCSRCWSSACFYSWNCFRKLLPTLLLGGWPCRCACTWSLVGAVLTDTKSFPKGSSSVPMGMAGWMRSICSGTTFFRNVIPRDVR